MNRKIGENGKENGRSGIERSRTQNSRQSVGWLSVEDEKMRRCDDDYDMDERDVHLYYVVYVSRDDVIERLRGGGEQSKMKRAHKRNAVRRNRKTASLTSAFSCRFCSRQMESLPVFRKMKTLTDIKKPTTSATSRAMLICGLGSGCGQDRTPEIELRCAP